MSSSAQGLERHWFSDLRIGLGHHAHLGPYRKRPLRAHCELLWVAASSLVPGGKSLPICTQHHRAFTEQMAWLCLMDTAALRTSCDCLFSLATRGLDTSSLTLLGGLWATHLSISTLFHYHTYLECVGGFFIYINLFYLFYFWLHRVFSVGFCYVIWQHLTLPEAWQVLEDRWNCGQTAEYAERWRHWKTHCWSAAGTLPTRPDAALHRDDESKCLDHSLEGRPSDFVSELQDVLLEGAFKCYRHQICHFFLAKLA